jgi:hypothetical protein
LKEEPSLLRGCRGRRSEISDFGALYAVKSKHMLAAAHDIELEVSNNAVQHEMKVIVKSGMLWPNNDRPISICVFVLAVADVFVSDRKVRA